jgi:hypothetical protein
MQTRAYRVRKTDTAQSRRILLVLSALVEIDQVRDCDDVSAIRDAMFALCLLQVWRSEIAPT